MLKWLDWGGVVWHDRRIQSLGRSGDGDVSVSHLPSTDMVLVSGNKHLKYGHCYTRNQASESKPVSF